MSFGGDWKHPGRGNLGCSNNGRRVFFAFQERGLGWDTGEGNIKIEWGCFPKDMFGFGIGGGRFMVGTRFNIDSLSG